MTNLNPFYFVKEPKGGNVKLGQQSLCQLETSLLAKHERNVIEGANTTRVINDPTRKLGLLQNIGLVVQ